MEQAVSAPDRSSYAELLNIFTTISISAAQAILRISGNRDARTKTDGSPITAADEAAEAVIQEGLQRCVPSLPVVSEESAERGGPTGPAANVIMVDPLDGTRDFIAGRDEYTVNIALISDGVPVVGVIAAPALGTIWRGIAGRGAERMEFAAANDRPCAPIAIRSRRRPPPDEFTVIVSRSHLEERTQAYLQALPRAKRAACGSSIKFCRVAEGSADLYPRLAPTHDWDIAAGHAILVAAGGNVTAPDGSQVVYGTKELLVPAFLAWGDPVHAKG